MHPISVIISTVCESARRVSLLRAIESTRAQGQDTEIIIVANGQRFDPAVLESLRAAPDLRVLYLPEGNLSKARRAGRNSVTKPFFAFLDDDDEFLPGAFAPLLAAIFGDPTLDIIIGNGVFTSGRVDQPLIRDLAAVAREPLLALLKGNWLSASSGIFRTASFDADYFDNLPKHHEWTMIAFRVVFEKRFRFLDVPMTRYNDTPESMSKSGVRVMEEEAILRKIWGYNLPPQGRPLLKAKMANNFHNISNLLMDANKLSDAWKYHFKSLGSLHGLKFLPFTRKLIARSLFSGKRGRAPLAL